jgi:hypothetical protein
LSYAKSLRNALKDKNEELYNKLQLIEDAAKSVLTYTVSKFPYYTPHDFSHSLNVEEILNWLVPDEIKLKMNAHEIFFLVAAAWLHDWGMVASESENAEEVRKLHHVRTEENFESLHDKVHLSVTEARIIGRMCRGHREENLLGPQYEDSFFGSNILIRVRFLTSLLRIADECDVTANRTPEIIYYSLKPEGASQEEFQKHLSIAGIGKSAPYKLVLSGVAKTPKGVEVIEGVKKQIQRQLDSVKAVLATHGVLLDVIEAKIDTRGFINRPIAFELDRKAIVDLLIGHSLYSRDDAAIRELLQNSVDTCRLRKTIDSSSQPAIEIEFDKDHISFRDNGLGMSFEDASNYFSKKGSSFYVSRDFEQTLKGRKFDPISKFGIGVLSSFLIANRMIVHTKKNNCAPCRFSITDLAEGWTYEEGAKKEQGTEITVYLNERGKELDFVDSLKHYAKNVEIPISIKNLQNGETYRLEQKWDHEIPEVLAEVSRDARDRFSRSKPMLVITGVFPALEVTYCVFDEGYFDSKNCFLANHGIYVGNFDLFPAHSSRWIALINLKSDIVDLTVSREGLVHNGKFKRFLEAVYDSFLSSIDRSAKENHPSDTNMQRCVRLAAYVHQFFISSFGIKLEDPRSSFLPMFCTRREYPVLTKEGSTFLACQDITEGKILRVMHYRLPIESYKEHIETVSHIFAPKMKDNEVLVFDLGPNLQFIKSPRKFVCSFCETLRSKGMSSVECCTLASFVPKLEFRKEDTALDFLLPSGSFFSHMPEDLRGVVVQIKPFEFTPSLDTLTQADSQLLELYHKLVARELLNTDPEMVEFYHDLLWPREKNVKAVSLGQFVYDADDQFLSFLISKADLILSNKALRDLTERYLKMIAIFYLSPRYLWRPNAETGFVTLLERTIADALSCSEKYVSLKKRVGKLSLIYNLVEL